jgi:hypothetical protein
MSFNRLVADDFVVSTDSITAGLWGDSSTPNLSTFITSSAQAAGSSGNFYLNVFSAGTSTAPTELEFAVTYGNSVGGGSLLYDPAVAGKSPSSTIYGSYRTLVLGDENASFSFGGVTSSDFWAISIDRNRYKESLFPGSLTLTISGSTTANKTALTLTDNSQIVTTTTFNDAGRVFQIVSGSAGTVFTGVNNNGYSLASGSYGFFLPDIATLLLNPRAITAGVTGVSKSFADIKPVTTANTDGNNPGILIRAISSSANPVTDGGLAAPFTLNSQENITSDFVFVRPRSSEYNYSSNPSFISGSTGEVLYNSFINNPQTYMTTVGLYNDTNELLAVAKLSKPLPKDFTKEALVRVKLDF